MSIPGFPIYIFGILRHHESMIYAHFLWRTHCPTKNRLKASVRSALSIEAPVAPPQKSEINESFNFNFNEFKFQYSTMLHVWAANFASFLAAQAYLGRQWINQI